jgi:hypothetical protein
VADINDDDGPHAFAFVHNAFWHAPEASKHSSLDNSSEAARVFNELLDHALAWIAFTLQIEYVVALAWSLPTGPQYGDIIDNPPTPANIAAFQAINQPICNAFRARAFGNLPCIYMASNLYDGTIPIQPFADPRDEFTHAKFDHTSQIQQPRAVKAAL